MRLVDQFYVLWRNKADLPVWSGPASDRSDVVITVEEVRQQLAAIREATRDDEVAHSMEDELYRRVLEAVADGADDAPEMAALALETKSIEFSRWMA